MKICGHCKRNKSTPEFSTNSRYKDGLHNWCRECSREYRREYEKTHPRPYSVRKKEYYLGNKDHLKARRRVNHLVERGLLPKVHTMTCVDCGGKAAHYDHYKGYEMENWESVQPVCVRCSGQRDIDRGDRRRTG